MSSRKSEILHFDGLLLSKSFCLSQKKYRQLCIIKLKNDAKFEEELTYALTNDMRNLVNFDPVLESSKICTLMGFL